MLTTVMIGNKIAEARKRVNISQAQLAHRLFISSQAVGKWERGESMPDIITFTHLAEILGVDLNYFSEGFLPAISVVAPAEPLVSQPDESASGIRKKRLAWDMSRGNWVGADFSGLKNLHEKFSSSNLQNCLFIGSDLSGLHLNGNNVGRCDFSGSDMSGSRIQRSNFSRNNFKECTLKETECTESFFNGCDFSGADFTGAIARSSGFEKGSMVNTVWNRTSFLSTHFTDIVLNGTMQDCSFENCAFTRVQFRNARIVSTFFKNNKNLKRVRFIDCQVDRMTYAFLKNGKAELSGITLLTE